MVKTKNIKRVPDLRFSEFEGEWCKSKLGDQVDRISSGKDKPEKEGEFDLYGSTGIIGKSRIFSHNGKYLLIARVGANAGTINYVEGKFSVTDNTLVIYAKETIDLDFTNAALQKFDLNRLIFGTGQPLITGGQLKSLRLYFPDLPEQEKIASFLSAVDKKIQQLTAKKQLLEQYKKGVMQRIFSQELRFTNDNGKDYPDWEERCLGEVLTERKSLSIKGEGYEHISLTKEGVVPKTKRYERDFLVGDDSSKKYKITYINDICYNPANLKFGVICRNSYGTGIFSPIYVTFEVVNNDMKFIEYLLTRRDFIQKARRFEEGTVYERMAVKPADFVRLIISLPTLSEQQKIAQFILGIEIKTRSVQSQLTQTQTFRKGLLQQLFV